MRLVDDNDDGANPDPDHQIHMGNHDEKYVTTDGLKYTTFALDDVKKAGVHDDATYAENIEPAPVSDAVTHLVHPRDPALVTTITQSCSSINAAPLATQQLPRLSPTLSPVSTFEVPLMTTPAKINTINGTPLAATAATTMICTPVSWTNTNAFTTDAACPTPYENGTYCGFINPEDPCAKQPGGMCHVELT